MPNRLVLYNGVVNSLDEQCVKYEAIALEASKVAGLGTLERLKTANSSLIDLKGAHVYPGFVDAHAHPYGMGERLTKPRLEATRSKEEVLQILRPVIRSGGENTWIVSRGWDQNAWPEKIFPMRYDLDEAFPAASPIALTRIDGHALWCNSKALEIAGIKECTVDPPGGSIERDCDGHPTGILLDEAMKLVESKIPQTSAESMRSTLRAGLQHFAEQGHVGAHEMGITAELWEVYKSLYAAEGDSLPRAYVFLDMTKETGRTLFLDKMRTGVFDDSPHERLKLVGVKLYLDGALGSRGAQLFEPYTDDPENSGLALMDDREVIDLMNQSAKLGLQIAVHAIGDKANARALRLFEESGVASSRATLRIEHAQIVREQDLPTFKRLGVHAVVQPAFYSTDRRWAVSRLGEKRMRDAYRWRSLIDHGIPFVASSDAPIELPNALEGIRLLVGRDGVEDAEALSLDTAIRSYAQTAYHLSNEQRVAGTLKIGMRADLTVVMPGFSKGISSKSHKSRDGSIDHPDSELLATIVSGCVLWGKPGTTFAP